MTALLTIPVADVDETFIGTRLMVTTPAGTFAGGLADVRQYGAGEVAVVTCHLPVLLWSPAAHLFLGGHELLLGHAFAVMVDPTPTALQALALLDDEATALQALGLLDDEAPVDVPHFPRRTVTSRLPATTPKDPS